jgi:phage/plasmid-associated DNA primase
MNIIEKYDLPKLHYLDSIKFDEFRNLLSKTDLKSKDLSNEFDKINCFKSFKKFIRISIVNQGETEIKYTHTTGCNEGRLFAKGGIQSQPTSVRGFLMKHTTDIDMTNAHPTILRFICNGLGIHTPKLDYFINHRNEVYDLHKMDRTDCKMLYLSILFQHYEKVSDVSFLNDYRKEIMNIHQELKKHYQHLYNDKTNNPFGTMTSKIIDELENKILQSMIRFFESKQIAVKVLMFDGCMIEGNLYNDENLLNELQLFIENEFKGLDMKFSFKPHCDKIVLPADFVQPSYYNQDLNFLQDITHVSVVLEIQKRNPESFVWSDNVLRCWTGIKWEANKNHLIKYISRILPELIRKEIIDNFILYIDEPDIQVDEQIRVIGKELRIARLKMETSSFIDSVISKCEPFLTNNEVQFDMNEYLIGFNNGVFDTRDWVFRPMKYDDFLTMSCGYDYSDQTDETRMNELTAVLKQIHPNDDERKLWLQVIAKGFSGRPIENFVIFNGAGGNGKGMIDEFADLIFGEYSYQYAPLNLITKDFKDGADPALSKMSKKRIIWFQEPSGTTKLKTSNIRLLTGGGKITARDLYANASKTTVHNHGIVVVECNKKPSLDVEAEQAEVRRFIDLYFGSSFTANPNEVDVKNRIYPASTEYKSPEWKLSHRNEFVQILLGSLKEFIKQDYKFIVPQSVQNRTDAYLAESFPLLQIFNNYFEKTDEPNSFVKIKDIIDKIKEDDIYDNFSKADKRKYNYKYMNDFFTTNKYFKKYYYEQKKIDGIKCSSILLGFCPVVNMWSVEDDGVKENTVDSGCVL